MLPANKDARATILANKNILEIKIDFFSDPFDHLLKIGNSKAGKTGEIWKLVRTLRKELVFISQSKKEKFIIHQFNIVLLKKITLLGSNTLPTMTARNLYIFINGIMYSIETQLPLTKVGIQDRYRRSAHY